MCVTGVPAGFIGNRTVNKQEERLILNMILKVASGRLLRCGNACWK
jgi:hypothetical protein